MVLIFTSNPKSLKSCSIAAFIIFTLDFCIASFGISVFPYCKMFLSIHPNGKPRTSSLSSSESSPHLFVSVILLFFFQSLHYFVYSVYLALIYLDASLRSFFALCNLSLVELFSFTQVRHQFFNVLVLFKDFRVV